MKRALNAHLPELPSNSAHNVGGIGHPDNQFRVVFIPEPNDDYLIRVMHVPKDPLAASQKTACAEHARQRCSDLIRKPANASSPPRSAALASITCEKGYLDPTFERPKLVQSPQRDYQHAVDDFNIRHDPFTLWSRVHSSAPCLDYPCGLLVASSIKSIAEKDMVAPVRILRSPGYLAAIMHNVDIADGVSRKRLPAIICTVYFDIECRRTTGF